MKGDVKTFSIALPLVLFGFLLFQIGTEWALLGHWNGRGIVLNTGLVLGQFLVFWVLGFVVLFLSGILLITRPSRALARISLVLAAVIATTVIAALGFVAIWDSLVAPGTPAAPKFAIGLMALALFLVYEGAKGVLVGFSDAKPSSRCDAAGA